MELFFSSIPHGHLGTVRPGGRESLHSWQSWALWRLVSVGTGRWWLEMAVSLPASCLPPLVAFCLGLSRGVRGYCLDSVFTTGRRPVQQQWALVIRQMNWVRPQREQGWARPHAVWHQPRVQPHQCENLTTSTEHMLCVRHSFGAGDTDKTAEMGRPIINEIRKVDMTGAKEKAGGWG